MIDGRCGGAQAGAEFFASVGRNVFVRKINVRFDVGQDEDETIANCIDAGAEVASELLVRGAQREFGAGVNKVNDGLGLGEIDAAVEKGAARKFARLSEARAADQEGVE